LLRTNRVKSGTPNIDEVVAGHGPFVWRVLGRLGVPSADVPDICQEVFVTVCRRLPDFDVERASLRSWLYGICVRMASDHRRRLRSRKEESVETLPEPQLPASQDDELERRSARAFLEQVLANLDEDKRAVFVLYELEELTMADVAQAVGCPVQTAYSRLHAARKVVESAFRRFNEPPIKTATDKSARSSR
jgi:RNA polymerase sigma-70 factor (ECF subfamily)